MLILTPFLASNAAMSPSEITIFFLSLAILLGLARILGEIARALGQPSVLGEILAGILLGPTFFGYLAPQWSSWLYPDSGVVALAFYALITLSVAMLLLVAGLEVDLNTVYKQGKTAVIVSLAGVIAPFVLGFSAAMSAPQWLGHTGNFPVLPFALFVGIAVSITALPVIAKILMDLNIFKSDLGMLIMSAAMLNDLIGWIGFAIVLALISSSPDAATHSNSVITTVSLTFLFILLMLTLVRSMVHKLMPYIQAHCSWPGSVLSFVMVIALLCASFTEYIGIHSIFGAFIAGVAIGDSDHLRERTRETILQFITNIFAPIFFASIGLYVNFIASFNLQLVIIIFTIATTGKILGCRFGAKLAKMPKRESWAVGFGMAAQGAMGIILGQLARSAGLITDDLFVAIIIMALGTSLISGPALQKLLQQKNTLKFSKLLSERHVFMSFDATNPKEAIMQLATRASDITGLDQSTLGEAIWAREQIIHTGLENGLAVPHARLEQIKQPTLLLGISRNGIDFDAADGSLAHIVCLLLTPLNDQQSQLELLRLVATQFGQAETRQRVLMANNATEILATLNLSEAHTHAM